MLIANIEGDRPVLVDLSIDQTLFGIISLDDALAEAGVIAAEQATQSSLSGNVATLASTSHTWQGRV